MKNLSKLFVATVIIFGGTAILHAQSSSSQRGWTNPNAYSTSGSHPFASSPNSSTWSSTDRQNFDQWSSQTSAPQSQQWTSPSTETRDQWGSETSAPQSQQWTSPSAETTDQWSRQNPSTSSSSWISDAPARNPGQTDSWANQIPPSSTSQWSTETTPRSPNQMDSRERQDQSTTSSQWSSGSSARNPSPSNQGSNPAPSNPNLTRNPNQPYTQPSNAPTSLEAPQEKFRALTDDEIAQKIRSAIRDDRALSTLAKSTEVAVKNNSVTLSGSVTSQDEKNRIASIARQMQGVKSVSNNILVRGY